MRWLITILLASLLALSSWSPAPSQDEAWPRRVLLTNDDGLEAEGLLALARAFAPLAETFVIAPLENRSGSTNYVSALAHRGIDVEPRSLLAGVTAYGVDGFPADAVVFGLTGLLASDPPDLVISGVNTGPNLADDWNLSGTVGAARTAAFLGVPAIAVSGWSDEHPQTLAALANWVVQLASSDLVRDLGPRGYLTVSVPRVPITEIDGVDVVRRGPRPWELSLEPPAASTDSLGRQRWTLSFRPNNVEAPEGTDVYAVAANRIAIVPMRLDEHDYDLLSKMPRDGLTLPPWPPRAAPR